MAHPVVTLQVLFELVKLFLLSLRGANSKLSSNYLIPFAKTYRGHGTDLALVAGILGMDTDDPRIPDSLKLHMNEAFGLFGLFKKRAMPLTQTQQPLL